MTPILHRLRWAYRVTTGTFSPRHIEVEIAHQQPLSENLTAITAAYRVGRSLRHFVAHVDNQGHIQQFYEPQRRHFHKGVALLGGAIVCYPAFSYQQVTTRIPFPPIMMLHPRHGENINQGFEAFLPVFTYYLKQDAYESITLRSWRETLTADPTDETVTPLPAKPAIISIDDLAMDRGNPEYLLFKGMHDHLLKEGMVAVYGIVTRPNLTQDADRWAEVADWVEEGFELATHSAQHSTWNKRDGTPREDWTQANYDAEIVASAQMIEERTEQPVLSLITPFGGGFDRAKQAIHPGVLEACRTAGIKFVVGINDGREPIELERLADDEPLYVGRTSPSTHDNAISAIYNVNVWYDENFKPFIGND